MALTEDDRFTSGDFAPVGSITYGCIFFNTLWMLEAVMQAIALMTEPENWNSVGSLSPNDCASLAVEMMGDFNPMVSMVGAILPYGGSAPPIGALWCDGASYLRVDYPALFTVISDTFGAVDSDHFNVPDLTARVPAGEGNSHVIGDTTGEEEHTLIGLEMPTHNHVIGNVGDGLAVAPGEEPVFIPNLLEPFTYTDVSGGSDPHNNMQPTLYVNYIICAR